jgi:hypothetical protein
MPSFELPQPPNPLPINLYAPVFCTCQDNAIYLFGQGDRPNTGQRLLLDSSGQQTGSSQLLPTTFIEGMAASENGFLILNSQVAADRYKAQFYRMDGSLEWECAVPGSRSHSRFVQPAVINGRSVAVWANNGGSTTRVIGVKHDTSILASLSLATLSAAGSEPPRVIPLKGSITALSIAAVPGGLLAACDPRGRLELLLVEDNGLAWQLQVEGVTLPVSPCLAVYGKLVCLAWISSETLFVQWFDLAGRAITLPQQLVSAPEGARLLSTCLISDRQERLAIAYILESTTDDWNVLQGEFGRQHRFLPRLVYQEWIALLQPGVINSSAWQPITPPGLPYHAGCWLQDSLFLLHGEQAPVITNLKAA